jgi:glutathione peroxidase
MQKIMFSLMLVLWSGFAVAKDSIYDLSYKGLDGKTHALSQHKGKVLLIVNTASHCGYTGQYKALQSLYDQYKQKGLVVIGFPSSSFGQEYDKETEVAQFCQLNYGVKFPMASIVEVKGKNQHPIFRTLTEGDSKEVRWNFEKFLVDKSGRVQARFASDVKPDSRELTAALEKLL